MIVTLDEAKLYLRVDTSDDDALISDLISAAQNLCMDIARLEETEFESAGDVAKIAVLYSTACLYEKRAITPFDDMTLKLRALLEGIRRAAF